MKNLPQGDGQEHLDEHEEQQGQGDKKRSPSQKWRGALKATETKGTVFGIDEVEREQGQQGKAKTSQAQDWKLDLWCGHVWLALNDQSWQTSMLQKAGKPTS